MSLKSDLDRVHAFLSNRSPLVYAALIATTVGAVFYSIRLIFITPVGPPVIWIVDIVVLLLFWLAHVRYLLRGHQFGWLMIVGVVSGLLGVVILTSGVVLVDLRLIALGLPMLFGSFLVTIWFLKE